MSRSRELHEQAMALTDRALQARLSGRADDANLLIRDAYHLEREAALLLATDLSLEPTRSVLLRSAASLALEVGDTREAERLIATALVGDPPDAIAEECRSILDQTGFQRHLDLHGVELSDNEVQMSVSGEAVGHGFIASREFMSRVTTAEKLVYRTAERKAGLPYREHGQPKAGIRQDYQLFLSVPRAASFAVSFRLGRQQEQMRLPGEGLRDPTEVIKDLIVCIRMYESDDEHGLEARIGQQAYLNNFRGLMGALAPDGEKVKQVGFTAVLGGEVSKARLTTTGRKKRTSGGIEKRTKTAEPVTVVGELLLADARTLKSGQKHHIVIVPDTGDSVTIDVPEGMLEDIVRPLFMQRVEVIGQRVGSLVHLESIHPVETD